MKVLATYDIKGGVGKTASVVNLAYLAARGGARHCRRRRPGCRRPSPGRVAPANRRFVGQRGRCG